MVKIIKKRVDGVVQGYHEKVFSPAYPMTIVQLLGLPDLMSLAQFDKNELKKRYPVSVSKGTLLYSGPSIKDPNAKDFTGLFNDDNEVHLKEKNLYHVAHFKDLFKYGKHIKIINRHSMVVRELVWKDKGIYLDPKSGDPNDIVLIDPNADILYEPWFDDVGSFMFVMPKNGPPGLQGHLMKLAVENDKVAQVRC